MKTVYETSVVKVLKKSLSIFFVFFSIYISIVYLFSEISWFSILLPICIVIAFLFTNKILLRIEYDEKTNKMNIVTQNFMLVKHSGLFPIDKLKYSYKEEKTSRLAKANVFRVYFDNKEIFNRYHELDGLKEFNVEKIIKEFQSVGIKEI
jgi:hypothetical protein